MSNIIDRILAEVCLDERIEDGIFDMSNNTHMDVLRESLTDGYGVSLNDAKTVHNKMVEGKYPERQAYNKDGLLVTFPTPQHKQRAIQRGTHFEKDPTTGPQNVFAGGQQPPPGQAAPSNVFGGQGQPAPKAPAPETPAPAEKPSAPAPAPTPATGQQPSKLPASDAPAPQPAAPTQSAPSSLPASDTPPQPTQQSDAQQLDVEPPPSTPVAAQSPAPPPNFDTPKSPQTRAAEAEAVKQIMHGDDTNPTLLPSPAERNDQLKEIYKFARRMGYKEAMKVILEALVK